MTVHLLQLAYLASIIFLILAFIKSAPIGASISSCPIQFFDSLIVALITLLLSYFALDTATFASTIRFNIGSFTVSLRKEVYKPLVLYDNEWDMQCLKVREAASSLGIPLLIYPIPQISPSLVYFHGYPIETRFLADALIQNPHMTSPGLNQPHQPMKHSPTHKQKKPDPQPALPIFPLLFDPNTGAVITGNGESINNYIYSQYSKRLTDIDPPPPLTIGPLDLATSFISTTIRKHATIESIVVRPSIYNKLPLHLYGNQSTAATRIIREWCCRLQLSYIIYPTSRGSMYRAMVTHHLGAFYHSQRAQLVYQRFSMLVAFEHEKKRLVDLVAQNNSNNGGITAHDGDLSGIVANQNLNWLLSHQQPDSNKNDNTIVSDNDDGIIGGGGNNVNITTNSVIIKDQRTNQYVILNTNDSSNPHGKFSDNDVTMNEATFFSSTRSPMAQNLQNMGSPSSTNTIPHPTSAIPSPTTDTTLKRDVVDGKGSSDNHTKNNPYKTPQNFSIIQPHAYKQHDHLVNSDQRLLMTSIGSFYRLCGNCMLYDPNTDITAFGLDAAVSYIQTMYAITGINATKISGPDEIE